MNTIELSRHAAETPAAARDPAVNHRLQAPRCHELGPSMGPSNSVRVCVCVCVSVVLTLSN